MNRIVTTSVFALLAFGCSSERAARQDQEAQRAEAGGVVTDDPEEPTEGEADGGVTQDSGAASDSGGGADSGATDVGDGGAIQGDIASIVVGGERACAVRTDGRVLCWGDIAHNGPDAYVGSTTTPTLVAGLTNVAEVSIGGFHTCARIKDGTVSCWGANVYGQLGDGTTTPRGVPTKVVDLDSVVGIAAGGAHTCAVRSDGTVRCWGSDKLGQIGTTAETCVLFGETRPCSRTPIAIPGLTSVVEVATGTDHTCVRRADGTVACFGRNSEGQLGDGTTSGPITLPGPGSGFKGRGTPETVAGLSGVAQIAAGGFTSCALLTNGQVRCWGGSNGGHSVDTHPSAPLLDNVASLGLGDVHVCARRTDGTVWCWGTNAFGVLGDGSTAIVRNTPGPVTGLTNIVQIDGGEATACALRADGAAFCWGSNRAGEVGDGTRTDRSTPVRVVF